MGAALTEMHYFLRHNSCSFGKDTLKHSTLLQYFAILMPGPFTLKYKRRFQRMCMKDIANSKVEGC